MNRRHVRGFIAFNAFVMLLTYAGISYAYVEPVRPVLPNVTETDLTNPDLPHRKQKRQQVYSEIRPSGEAYLPLDQAA